MRNSFGVVVFNATGSVVDTLRLRKVQLIAFDFFVAVVVGAQYKTNVLPFATNWSAFCNGGKSFALFTVIELIRSSVC